MDTPSVRHFRPAPFWLVLLSLAATGALFLSERYYWFAFNEHKGWTVVIAVAAVGVVVAAFFLLWIVVAFIFRRRFQFSLRTLLALVVAVALPCSWLAVEMKKARQQKDTEAAITEPGGAELDLSRPSVPAWLEDAFGEDFFCDVEYVNPRARRASDAWLEHIKGFTRLKYLVFSGPEVTDVGFKNLKRLTRLQKLYITNTRVTDAGLENFQNMTELRELDLPGNPLITNAGLEHFKNLEQLEELYFGGTQVTDEGIKKLQRALPNCRISH
jgi:hypothetical protein